VLKLSEGLSSIARQSITTLFEREAQTIAKLNHPAIVQVIDYGATPMHDGSVAPWMVLEWLDGTTLEDHIDRIGRRPLSPAEALRLMRPTIEAIALAHAHQIAHRDIKPSNLMCVPDWKGELTLRVLDFGIARLMQPDETPGSGHTRTRAAVAPFSPPYAAPEQVLCGRTKPWTDVHALALVLVELLTGRMPYGESDDISVYCAAAVAPQRPTPAFFGIDVGALEPALARALSSRPDARFRDATELLVALDAALATPATYALGASTPLVATPSSPRRALRTVAMGVGVVVTAAIAAGFIANLRTQPSTPRVRPALAEPATAPIATVGAPAPAAPTPSTPTPVIAAAQPTPSGATPTPTEPNTRHIHRRSHSTSNHTTTPTAAPAVTTTVRSTSPRTQPCIGANCRHAVE
jgi:serine/threonine-protein kinase